MLETYKRQDFNNNTSLNISEELLSLFQKRRSIRHFSDEQVNLEIILNAIKIAGLSPSGANKQPWSFALIDDQKTKREIRDLAQSREKVFYQNDKSSKFRDDLAHLHTDENKPCLTQAKYLLPIFYQNTNFTSTGESDKNYFVKESVGIATGMLISALHICGLCTLTYTPTKMQFLTKFLHRPSNEKLFLLLLVGLPEKNAQVPVISKKVLTDILTIYKPKGVVQ